MPPPPDSNGAPSSTLNRGVIGWPFGRGPAWAARETFAAGTWNPESTMPSGCSTRSATASPSFLPVSTSISRPCTSTATLYSQRSPGLNLSASLESLETISWTVSPRSPIPGAAAAVGQARGVAQQVLHRHRSSRVGEVQDGLAVGAGHFGADFHVADLGQIFRDGVADLQPPLLHELHQGR